MPGKPLVHISPVKHSSSLSRRQTVSDAIPTGQRLLEKEHMMDIDEVDQSSIEEKNSYDDEEYDAEDFVLEIEKPKKDAKGKKKGVEVLEYSKTHKEAEEKVE